MKEELKQSHPMLGERLTGNEPRDAIHIAILPVKAGGTLAAGAWVRVEQGFAIPCAPAKAHGVIDPFITGNVAFNDVVYVMLKPYRITTLTHAWEHPEIPSDTALQPQSKHKIDEYFEHRECIVNMASMVNVSVTKMLEIADEYASGADYISMGNNENYQDVPNDAWPPFWKAYEALTGNKGPKSEIDQYGQDKQRISFSCAC